MTQSLSIHPTHPQPRLLKQAAERIRAGAVVAYPTDSCYALGCHLGDKDAMERIRALRGFGKDHHFTLVCRDLSEIAQYAKVDTAAYRLLRAVTPGAYTFLLPATREVPRRLQHPKRRTIGIRVPDHPVVQGLLEALGEPLMSCTLLLPGEVDPPTDAESIAAALGRGVDLILDGGACGFEPTTVVDLFGEAPMVVRAGKGALAPLGL
ncbi:MAG TPA: L-threonylcarbamoyladenylate synthase [Candidatus Acidoferrales bacterium]|nr:L-threonylcarbamoyladenylate synthase [Candidatus Acidoferrales bacterium]